MKILYSPRFAREYKKLSKAIKGSAEVREKIFRNDPFDPALDAYKLHGRLKNFWSFSINAKFRIVFEFGDDGMVYFHSVGDHSIYR